ncbi:MAG TPA: PilZ domain-containing protein [Sphingomicrobium sp.]
MIETKITRAGRTGDTPGRRVTNKGRENKGRRVSARDSLFLAATIRRRTDSEEELVPVRVRNLSVVGLMADYDREAEVGEPVVVTLRGVGKVPGMVAWVENGRIGVAFDEDVDPLLARRPLSQAAPEPVQRRPL